ncbi:MAG: peptidyl-prolyl cis-trans isomerase [Chloroflexi bacterium]|nr:peptidyl-prolyl cis-trans isomerase [Chloroflexota bacterium]
MPDGWSQVWKDVRDSLRGGAESRPDLESPPLRAAVPPKQLLSPWQGRGWMAISVLLVGVLLVVSLAGPTALSILSEWASPRPPAPDVVATFNGGQITISDLEAGFRRFIPEGKREAIRSLQILRVVLREMVVAEMIRRWAISSQMSDDAAFRYLMRHIGDAINLSAADREHVDRLESNASIARNSELLEVPAPSEAGLQSDYQADQAAFVVPAQFTVDVLAFPIGGNESMARAAAAEALVRLNSGDDFAAIAARMPDARLTEHTVVAGGTLGDEWDKAVGALRPGEFSEVLRAGDSFHIVRLLASRPSRTQTFDEARPTILKAARATQTKAWMEANARKTLFSIKGREYTLGQFYREYQVLPQAVQVKYAGATGMKELVDRLIDRLVLVEIINDEAASETIDQARLSLLSEIIAQQEVDDKVQIPEEDIRAYYDRNSTVLRSPPQVKLRYIRIALGQLPDRQRAAHALADQAYALLTQGFFGQGADFASVAREYSDDAETAAGGELSDWLGEAVNPFEPLERRDVYQQALKLKVDEISQPFEAGDSAYIAQVLARTDPQGGTFEADKPYIGELLAQLKREQLRMQLRDRLLGQAGLVIYDGVLRNYLSTAR